MVVAIPHITSRNDNVHLKKGVSYSMFNLMNKKNLSSMPPPNFPLGPMSFNYISQLLTKGNETTMIGLDEWVSTLAAHKNYLVGLFRSPCPSTS